MASRSYLEAVESIRQSWSVQSEQACEAVSYWDRALQQRPIDDTADGSYTEAVEFNWPEQRPRALTERPRQPLLKAMRQVAGPLFLKFVRCRTRRLEYSTWTDRFSSQLVRAD